MPAAARAPRPGSVAVFILAGGLGTRLRATDPRPKAIVPVAGRPFLHYTLRLLRAQGYRKIVLCLGAGAAEVKRAFAGKGLVCSVEREPLGTGGALALAAAHAERFNLILNGDSYAQAIYGDLLAAHLAGEAPARGVTLLAVRQENCEEYGRLELAEDGRVAAFVEKGEAVAGWINAGVYAAPGSWMRELPTGRYSLERDVLPELAATGRLRALPGRFFFRDIGTPDRLRAAEEEFRWIRRREEDAA
jgi:NDP-sugar pyrophosphorylase family protein